jgi:hypothetical protein
MNHNNANPGRHDHLERIGKASFRRDLERVKTALKWSICCLVVIPAVAGFCYGLLFG